MTGELWGLRLRAAVRLFGLSSREFWDLSMREWRALTEDFEAAALDRSRFEQLATLFPDGDDGRSQQ